MNTDDETPEGLEDEAAPGQGIEPTPAGFAHWVAEQYAGDDRFVAVEVEDPGPLDEESVRVRFVCDDDTHFLVSVLADDAIVRVGMATENKELVERVEEAAEQVGGALTDLLAEGVDAEEDLEHEVEHWHDDMDYFAADIMYQRDDDLFTDILRDEVVFYLDGFFGAFYDLIFEEE